MKRRGIIGLIWLALLGLGSPATAQDEAEQARNGLYILGSFGFGSEAFDTKPPPPFTINPAIGVKGIVGFKFLTYLAVQADVEWLGTGFQLEPGTDSTNESLMTPLTFTVDAKATPLRGKYQPYILAGVGLLHATSDQDPTRTALAARFGGGVDIMTTEHTMLSFGISYVLATGDLDGLSYLSYDILQFGYRF